MRRGERHTLEVGWEVLYEIKQVPGVPGAVGASRRQSGLHRTVRPRILWERISSRALSKVIASLSVF